MKKKVNCKWLKNIYLRETPIILCILAKLQLSVKGKDGEKKGYSMRPDNLVISFNTQGDFNDSEQLATESREYMKETTKGRDTVHVTKKHHEISTSEN